MKTLISSFVIFLISLMAMWACHTSIVVGAVATVSAIVMLFTALIITGQQTDDQEK